MYVQSPMPSLHVCATQWHTNVTRVRSCDRVGHGLPSPCHHLPPSTRTPQIPPAALSHAIATTIYGPLGAGGDTSQT